MEVNYMKENNIVKRCKHAACLYNLILTVTSQLRVLATY